MERGNTMINNARDMMINQATRSIIRNDQKFFAEAFQKSDEENFSKGLPSKSNNPPVRNAFTMKLTGIINKILFLKDATRLLKAVPGSVKASTSKPYLNFSTIMLELKPVFNTPFIGIASKRTMRRVIIRTIRAPFHNVSDLVAPDLTAFRIFIFRVSYNEIKLTKNWRNAMSLLVNLRTGILSGSLVRELFLKLTSILILYSGSIFTH